MRRIFFSFSILAVAFALVLGLGTFNGSYAVPGGGGDGYNLLPGETNMFADDIDMSRNVIPSIDLDRARGYRGDADFGYLPEREYKYNPLEFEDYNP